MAGSDHWVANQHIANGNEVARMTKRPCRTRSRPDVHCDHTSRLLGSGASGFWCWRGVWQASAAACRPRTAAPSATTATRWWLEWSGIEAQAGDHTDPAAHVVEQFDSGKTAVGDPDDTPIWQPACGLQQHLPAPVGQLLVSLLPLAGI